MINFKEVTTELIDQHFLSQASEMNTHGFDMNKHDSANCTGCYFSKLLTESDYFNWDKAHMLAVIGGPDALIHIMATGFSAAFEIMEKLELAKLLKEGGK